MMPIAWDAWSSWVAGRLLAGSLQGAVAVALVWLVCRRFPAIPASGRAQAWWIVSLGLLLSLASLPSLPIPLLPAPTTLVSVALANGVSDQHAAVGHRGRAWVNVTIALWMAGVLVQLYRLVSAYASLRGAVRRSAPLAEDDGADANRAAVALGLTHTPRIRLSDEIEAPLVTGIVHPVVLIPSSAIDGLSPRERAMLIGHELAHIRRRDLLFAWVPAIAERLFFFHPLARLAAREYAAERESACDAIVLNTMDVAPQEYGRMLVRLGVGGLNPMFTVGGSSPSVSALKRRLEMLHHALAMRSSGAAIAVVIVAMMAVVPLRAVPRAAARSHAPENSNIEQAVAGHQGNIQPLRDAFVKLQADMATLSARERELRSGHRRQQADSLQGTVEDRRFAERRRELVAKEAELETTKQLLENRLRELTAGTSR